MKARITFWIGELDRNVGLDRIALIIRWILAIFVCLYTVIILSIPLYETSAHKGIVFAKDNDAGRAIEVSMQTRWYKSNHFAPYGNLYHRLSHTLADLLPIETESLHPVEAKERTHNLSLKLVSLFSLGALCFFLIYLLFGMRPETFLLSSFLLLVSANIELWAEWVVRPHPEHLLMLFAGLACWSFFKLLANPTSERDFWTSALLWGLAMSVKRATAIFIPGILLFLLFPFDSNQLKRTAKYVGIMLSSYLVIGFPQNFGFYKHIRFMLYENSLHSMGDLGTITSGISLVFAQVFPVLLPIIVLSFFSQTRARLFNWKAVVFVALSFLPILLRKTAFNCDHHTMPLAIASVLLALSAVLQLNPWRMQKWSTIVLIIAGLIGVKLFGTPKAYQKAKEAQMECRKEMHQIIEELHKGNLVNKFILKEPFFPSDHNISSRSKTIWGLRWADISENVGLLGILDRTFDEYHDKPPKTFYGKMIEDYDKKKDFYNSLRGKDEVSYNGSVFQKKLHLCGYQLWESVK